MPAASCEREEGEAELNVGAQAVERRLHGGSPRRASNRACLGSRIPLQRRKVPPLPMFAACEVGKRRSSQTLQ